MVTARAVPFGGRLPAGTRLGRITSDVRRGWLLELRDDAGRIGRGEASPLPGYSPDDAEAAGIALRAWTPPNDVDDHHALVAATAAVVSPSARFAVESAWLDLAAQRAGVPLHVLLSPDGRRDGLPLNVLLPDGEPADAAAFAAREAARGVRAVKRKLGADLDRELAILDAVRGAAPAVDLRVDANSGLRPGDVAAFCLSLARLGVACIEEPVGWEQLLRLERLAVPVALDESLQSTAAEEIIDRVAAHHSLAAVVLKPTALGGILRCRALAAHASRRGAAAIVTHTFDGPVAMAAAAELALALPEVAVAGLAPHAGLAAYPRWHGAALGETTVTPHVRPGLGLGGEGS